MMGMDELTGKLIDGEAWIRQGVRRALRTPKGSRPMVRWYGTNHLKYLDQPISQALVLDLTADLADSIEKTISDARLETILDQRRGEELIVNLRLGIEQRSIGV